MALATIATIATIVGVGASVGGSVYAATRKPPEMPDGASSSREVALAQAQAFPGNLGLQQLMQQGGKGSVYMPAHQGKEKMVEVTVGQEPNRAQRSPMTWLAGGAPIFSTNNKRELVPYVESEWQEGGKYFDQLENGKAPWYYVPTDVPAGPQEFDFTGYGTADIEGKRARDQADLELEIGKKYGVDFATQARLNQEQADPLGTAARAKEYELLQKETPVSPISGTLNDQITAQVKAGRGVDPMSAELLDRALAQANAVRGNQTAGADVLESLGTGAQGEARAQAAAGKGRQFLASGQTPEDIAYRRTQQGISNLGAFVNGQTPQSQFGNISRANQGAAPVTGAQKNATMPNNAGQIGQNFASNAYAANVNAAQNNPSWLTGLSSILSGIGGLKAATG